MARPTRRWNPRPTAPKPQSSAPPAPRDADSFMRVKELTALHVLIPLRKPIRHASHTRTETDNLIVRCLLEDGTAGYGEGVPREYVTGETIDSAVALLKRSD